MTGVTPTIECKQLNCGDGVLTAGEFQRGEGSGPTWLDHVKCTEQHSSLWQCPSGPWKWQSCDYRSEETHIICNGSSNGVMKTTASLIRREAPALPGDVTQEDYDDVKEVSDPNDDHGPGQCAREVTGAPGESDRNRDSQTDWSLHLLRSEEVSEAERNALSLLPGDPGYDDVEDGVSGTSL
nr:antigen WC1.1-like [Chrysemys picta bellii]